MKKRSGLDWKSEMVRFQVERERLAGRESEKSSGALLETVREAGPVMDAVRVDLVALRMWMGPVVWEMGHWTIDCWGARRAMMAVSLDWREKGIEMVLLVRV